MGNAEALTWHPVCTTADVDEQEIVRFDLRGKVYAIIRTPSGYYATDGLCPHEQADLSDGLVDGEHLICPKHNSRFHIPTGKVLRVPARKDLGTYPVKIEEGRLYLGLTSPGPG